ncbi:Uncharacterized conserved protein [Lutibacter oricola]|uniref:Uncharacterized conserved protein n=1 Tax=Lutibacter oricola TaxID=762486 RepID=A0A1H2YXH7_9FLAO|nr:DUF2249 domain-containing protein [Lutibacter oricola]SDX09892.1 Uncharacterized conserved protein [Lutibacter oricola]
MKISQHTKISTLIKEHKSAIDIIASINPHFKKLQNPLLRKVLAPRVTISDAAKIGGISVETFLSKLKTIGFEIENDTEETSQKEEIIMDKSNVLSFDVRELLAGGTDPFKAIMEKIKILKKGQTLEIINTFEPIPLINVLKSKGFIAEVERKNDLVYTYFQKVEDAEINVSESTCTSENNFDDVYKTYIGKMEHIDVRHLEMPEPMTTILEKLETLPEGFCLVVDHKKVPQFLLPELKERNFDIFYNKIDEHNIQLLIRRA